MNGNRSPMKLVESECNNRPSAKVSKLRTCLQRMTKLM